MSSWIRYILLGLRLAKHSPRTEHTKFPAIFGNTEHTKFPAIFGNTEHTKFPDILGNLCTKFLRTEQGKFPNILDILRTKFLRMAQRKLNFSLRLIFLPVRGECFARRKPSKMYRTMLPNILDLLRTKLQRIEQITPPIVLSSRVVALRRRVYRRMRVIVENGSFLFLSFLIMFVVGCSGISGSPKKQNIHIEKCIQISSIQQKIIDKNHIIFEGEVEVWIDKKMHILADSVEVDHKERSLYAFCNESCAVTIETKDFLIVVNNFRLNLESRVGSAEEVRIHTSDGYISARRAEKIGDYEWFMHDVCYTACDAHNPHWQITARKASVFGGCFIKMNWLLFKIGRVPIFALPKMVIPFQTLFRAGKRVDSSGFLIPKFYFDYENGFGFKQEYYQSLGSRCDTTIGFDWHEHKGIAFFDEFRWVRSPGSYTLSNAYYALARHNFKEKEGKLLSVTKHRYWISGKDFCNYSIFKVPVQNLVRVDFGTDKRIGYQFFDSFEHIDDTFYNSWITRLCGQRNLVELKADETQTRRKRFSPLGCDDIKELENRVSTFQAPAFSWHSPYYVCGNLVLYRHDLFFDHMLYREMEIEKNYVKSLLVDEKSSIPFNKAQVVRLDYRGALETSLQWHGNTITGGIYPIMQMRSLLPDDCYLHERVYEKRLFAQGAGRCLLTCAAEWSLPELVINSIRHDYSYSMLPTVRWDYVPFFDQRHWFFMDDRDRIFAQHQIEASLAQYWLKKETIFGLSLTQAYEFNKNDVILPIRRSLSNNHLLPLEVRAEVQHNFFRGSAQQEFDLQDGRLVSAEFTGGITFNRVNCNVGYLFQPRLLQQKREFLSNISHFIVLDCVVPIGKSATIQYAGQFYVEKGSRFMNLSGIKPLLHTVRFEYSGHCYGFYLGYEEKKYREFGHDKHERAIVFSLRLNTLGSFAKRFKRPHIMDCSKINDEDLYGLS